MRLAPGIRYDDAALRTRLEAFLEAVAVVGRNDQCPGFAARDGSARAVAAKMPLRRNSAQRKILRRS